MKNEEVAAILLDISRILEMEGAQAFRIRAYRRASQSIGSLNGDVNDYYRGGRLTEIPGIGESISRLIAELLTTGKSEFYESLKKDVPPQLYEVVEAGVGRKTAIKVYERLGVANASDFLSAARSHRIRKIKGLGVHTEKKIADTIEKYLKREEAMLVPLHRAAAVAGEIIRYLDSCPYIDHVEIAGDLRRHAPMIEEVNLIAASSQPAEAIEFFCVSPMGTTVMERGDSSATIVTRFRLKATLEISGGQDYGLRLLFATGSVEHTDRLTEHALRQSVRLTGDGYYYEPAGTRTLFSDEQTLYRALGLEYVPPELREGRGEVEAAAEGTLPRLVDIRDIRGDLHVHTEWSDGADSIQDMVMAARARGYEYLAICDHSRSLHVAGGLSIDQLRDQMAEIDRLNDTLEGFAVLKGSEVDIMPDGSLDLPDEVLRDLDIVVGSIHTQLRQEPDVMTRRVLDAMENEYLTILAHPTSRLLGSREPTGVDIDRVIDRAKESGIVLEVNAFPDRLDLSDENVLKAMDSSAMISIDTDAHSIADLDYMPFGVHNARRGWATPSRVLNALSYDALVEFLERKGR